MCGTGLSWPAKGHFGNVVELPLPNQFAEFTAYFSLRAADNEGITDMVAALMAAVPASAPTTKLLIMASFPFCLGNADPNISNHFRLCEVTRVLSVTAITQEHARLRM